MKVGTPSAPPQGARGRAMGACPNGHRTLWPRRCPWCRVEAFKAQEAARQHHQKVTRAVGGYVAKTLEWRPR